MPASRRLQAANLAALNVTSYEEHARTSGATAEAVAYVQAELDGQSRFGVGIDRNTTKAAIKALLGRGEPADELTVDELWLTTTKTCVWLGRPSSGSVARVLANDRIAPGFGKRDPIGRPETTAQDRF